MNPNPDLSVMFLLVIAAMNIFLAAMASKVYMMTNRRIYLFLAVLFVVTVPQATALAYMEALQLDFSADVVGVSSIAVYALIFAVFSVVFLQRSTIAISVGLVISVVLFVILAIPLRIKPYWPAASGVIGHFEQQDPTALGEGQDLYGFVSPMKVSLLKEPGRIALIEKVVREEGMEVIYTCRLTEESGEINWRGILRLEFNVWVDPDKLDDFLWFMSVLENSEIPLPTPEPYFFFIPENA